MIHSDIFFILRYFTKVCLPVLEIFRVHGKCVQTVCQCDTKSAYNVTVYTCYTLPSTKTTCKQLIGMVCDVKIEPSGIGMIESGRQASSRNFWCTSRHCGNPCYEKVRTTGSFQTKLSKLWRHKQQDPSSTSKKCLNFEFERDPSLKCRATSAGHKAPSLQSWQDTVWNPEKSVLSKKDLS